MGDFIIFHPYMTDKDQRNSGISHIFKATIWVAQCEQCQLSDLLFGTPLEPWPADTSPVLVFFGEARAWQPGRGISFIVTFLWLPCSPATQGINVRSGENGGIFHLNCLWWHFDQFTFWQKGSYGLLLTGHEGHPLNLYKILELSWSKNACSVPESNRWSPVNTWGSCFSKAFATTTLVQENRVDSDPLEIAGWDLKAITCEMTLMCIYHRSTHTLKTSAYDRHKEYTHTHRQIFKRFAAPLDFRHEPCPWFPAANDSFRAPWQETTDFWRADDTYLGVSQSGGTPIRMVYNWKSY